MQRKTFEVPAGLLEAGVVNLSEGRHMMSATNGRLETDGEWIVDCKHGGMTVIVQEDRLELAQIVNRA
jgi:hypothetical protein